MFHIASLRTDEKLEVEGVVRQLGGGAFIKVARENNDNYVREITDLVEANRELLDSGTPEAQELDKQLVIEAMAKTILVDFEVALDGKKLKYSFENAVKVLSDNKDFRRLVVAESRKFENYKLAKEKKQGKNS